jgi:hypothetical protein
MIHTLKIFFDFYYAVKSGEKTFEVRENDRGYQKGDKLILRAYCTYYLDMPALFAEVSYVLSGFGIKEGFVVLGLKDVRIYDEKHVDI